MCTVRTRGMWEACTNDANNSVRSRIVAEVWRSARRENLEIGGLLHSCFSVRGGRVSAESF